MGGPNLKLGGNGCLNGAGKREIFRRFFPEFFELKHWVLMGVLMA
jgi:hypothetical protein